MPPNLARELETKGFTRLPATPESLAWAKAARAVGQGVAQDQEKRAKWLRHGGTWFVGVDALPTDHAGAIGGAALPFADLLQEASGQAPLHRAQLSVVYPGYPAQAPEDTTAAHAYRLNRASAHVDGLHRKADGGRSLLEPHALILGIALSEAEATASPLRVWPGSHKPLGKALSQALPPDPTTWPDINLAPVYTTARRAVFDSIQPIPVALTPGDAVVLHRHTLHGIAPWAPGATAAREGRMTAYFRPTCADPTQWRA